MWQNYNVCNGTLCILIDILLLLEKTLYHIRYLNPTAFNRSSFEINFFLPAKLTQNSLKITNDRGYGYCSLTVNKRLHDEKKCFNEKVCITPENA